MALAQSLDGGAQAVLQPLRQPGKNARPLIPAQCLALPFHGAPKPYVCELLAKLRPPFKKDNVSAARNFVRF
jgi:hypothetical protein